MKLFGITGGIGMGKSTAGDLLLEKGYCLVDTDIIAREVVAPGQPAFLEIQQAFGDRVISEVGELRRDELAKIVFSDATARQNLESILHPRIREVWQAETQKWRALNRSVGFVIIPLLFETAASHCFDAIICLACSPSTQWGRLKSRSWNDAAIRARIAAQWPIEKKMAAADYVVWTDTTVAAHAAQLDRILHMEVN